MIILKFWFHALLVNSIFLDDFKLGHKTRVSFVVINFGFDLDWSATSQSNELLVFVHDFSFSRAILAFFHLCMIKIIKVIKISFISYRFHWAFAWEAEKFQHSFDVRVQFCCSFTSVNFIPQDWQVVFPDLIFDFCGCEPAGLSTSVGNDETIISYCDGGVFLDFDDVFFGVAAVFDVMNFQFMPLL